MIIETAIREKKELFYPCSFCKTNYYPNTQRYECRQCKIKVCLECKDKHLKDKNHKTNKVKTKLFVEM